jgi:hypothetical protein
MRHEHDDRRLPVVVDGQVVAAFGTCGGDGTT